MKIVVLMSTYNGELYIGEQIQSIVTQTLYSNIQIIIRDDGSTDGTLEVLRKYEEKDKIDIIKGENIGCARSFHNLLVHAPVADYYAFADQDDYWLPNKIEKAIDKIAIKSGPALYGSKQIIVNESLENMLWQSSQIDTDPTGILVKNRTVAGCTIVFNSALRDIYLSCDKVPLYDERIYAHDLWLMKLAIVVGEFVYSKDAYILYRQHSNNLCGAGKNGYRLFWERIRKLIFSSEYKKSKKASNCARALLDCYGKYIHADIKDFMIDLSKCSKSMSARKKVFLNAKINKDSIYEYLGYKIFILLGWI